MENVLVFLRFVELHQNTERKTERTYQYHILGAATSIFVCICFLTIKQLNNALTQFSKNTKTRSFMISSTMLGGN